MNAFVMNTGRQRREDMKGINVIQTPQSDTDVPGRGYVTVTLQRTRSARNVSEMGSWLQCKKYTTSYRCQEVERMTKAISCLFAPLVTHRLLLEMVIVGEGVGGNQSL